MSLKDLKKKGFTLIELMIVVAIIGILAAVAIPKFADLITRSKEASVKGTLGALRSAVSIYYSDTEGEFPSNLFEGLTLENKYLPTVGGVRSLGRIDIPKNKQGNPGHDFGAGGPLSDPSNVKQNSSLVPVEVAGVALAYATGAAWSGDLVVNCTHEDTKLSRWTSY